MSILSYFQQQRLTLQSGTALPAAQSLLTLVGQGELEATLNPKPDAAALLAAIEQAYQDGYEQQASTEFELQGIAFAGSGDPLLALELLSQVLPAFKAQRHGVPVTLVSGSRGRAAMPAVNRTGSRAAGNLFTVRQSSGLSTGGTATSIRLCRRLSVYSYCRRSGITGQLLCLCPGKTGQ